MKHHCFENITDMQRQPVAHDTASLQPHHPLFLGFLLGIVSFQHCASSLFDITIPWCHQIFVYNSLACKKMNRRILRSAIKLNYKGKRIVE
jgi:hypothetical protein